MSINSLVAQPENRGMLVKNFLNNKRMSFGSELRSRRKDKRFTQAGLAKAANNVCTGAYISDLERDYYVGKKGRPTRPDIDIVDALARALDWPIKDARTAAGHAPGDAPDRPTLPDDVFPSGYEDLPPERQQKFLRQWKAIGDALLASEKS